MAGLFGMVRICALSLLATTTAIASSKTPLPKPDPAVEYANMVRANDIAYSEGYFEWNGLKLHYVEAGEGDLVILYHGFPSFWYSYIDQMEVLKKDYRVVAVDALGAGLSDKPKALKHYTVEALAAQLDALARHLAGNEKFYLIGHDWGGALAWSYAEAYPDRLHGVVGMSAPSYNVFLKLIETNELQRQASKYMRVIANTPHNSVIENPPGERLWSIGYSKLIEAGQISPEEGQLFRQALAPPDASNGGYNWYRANVPPFDQVTAQHYWPFPPTPISVPSLLIWGSEDKVFVGEFIDLMQEGTPRFEKVIIPGVGHWTSIEKPDVSTTAIVDFLSSAQHD